MNSVDGIIFEIEPLNVKEPPHFPMHFYFLALSRENILHLDNVNSKPFPIFYLPNLNNLLTEDDFWNKYLFLPPNETAH
ncbi:MAG: hypothetical protein AABW51_05150 [Nanoarchaeota archaeon]